MFCLFGFLNVAESIDSEPSLRYCQASAVLLCDLNFHCEVVLLKWGIVSDIHANLEALNQVLKVFDKEGVQKIAVLGDMVGGGARPEEVLAILRERATLAVMGDHDAAVLGRIPSEAYSNPLQTNFEWTRKALSKESWTWLGKRPRTASVNKVMFVHATPFNAFYGDVLSNGITIVQKFAYTTLFCGHAHASAVLRNGQEITAEGTVELLPKDIVVVGSAGWPTGRNPAAHYIIWDQKKKTVNLGSIDYDVEAFIEDARRGGFSGFARRDLPNKKVPLTIS